MLYIYGPLNSRRLGSSLGVNLNPHKICNFDCIYCQLGRTTNKTCQRKEYASIEEIIFEFKSWFRNNPAQAEKLGYITLSGCGEPLLNSGIGRLVQQIKSSVHIKVAVLTNASLLSDPKLRQEILEADLIVPSLDAAAQAIFEKIDRPLAGIAVDNIIEGLVALRAEFKGKIWLEVMLVKGVNDDLRHIKKLKEAIERIKPDIVHLNSPARATAETGVFSLAESKLKKIKEIIGENCQIL